MAVKDSNLYVRVKVIGERQLDNLSRKITRLGDVSRGYGNRLAGVLEDGDKKWKKHFDFVDKAVKMMGQSLIKFVGMSAKFATVQVAGLGAAMMAVHAAFVLGNAAVKVYRGALQLLAGAAAGAVVALSAVAAAMREQQAAMYAYKGTGKNEFGAGINQIRVEMRGLMTDTELASVGAENLMSVFSAVSKTGTYTAGTTQLLKGLMDFASAGQDIKTGTKAAGDLLATLSDPKADFGKITEAAKALGPEMEKALEEAKKKGVDTAAELKAAILDGSLATMGGVSGQFDAVNNTLINRGKATFAIIKEMFADFGQPFLEPLKVELAEIGQIFRTTFTKIAGDVTAFGNGTFIGNISVVIEKMANFFVKLFQDYLPKVDGMFSRMGEWWSGFKDGWNSILDTLRPLIDAAKVLESMFMNILRPVGDMIGEGFTHMRDLIVDNEKEFNDFGTAVGKFIKEFSEFARSLREIFVEALPFITKVVDGATALFDIFTSLLGTLKKFTGGLGAFGPFALIAGLLTSGRSMKNTMGGMIQSPNLKTMNVNAQSVYLGGAGAGGLTAAGQVSGAGGMRSGQLPPPVAGTGTGATPPSAPITNTRELRQWAKANGIKNWATMTPAQLQSAGANFQNFGMAPTGLIGQARQGMRNRRSGYAATRLFGGEYAGKQYKGINKSMGAGMAASLGLGMLSNVAGPEAQGALALGSTIGMFNPLAGLAVGLGGTALTATTVGGGALAGAGAGAAMGAFLGPGGMLAGAAIGGLVGGISGWINGDKKKKKEARDAGERAMRSMVGEAINGFNDATRMLGTSSLTTENVGARFDQLSSTLTNSARTAYDEIMALPPTFFDGGEEKVKAYFENMRTLGKGPYADMSDADIEAAVKRPREFAKELLETSNAYDDAIYAIEEKYTSRLEAFTDMSGLSQEAIIDLARSLDLDLMDASMETSEMIKALAAGMIRTFRDLNVAASNRMGELSGILGSVVEKREATLAIDEIARNIYDASQAGALTGPDGKAMLAGQLQSMMTAMIQVYGGDVVKAEAEFFRQFGPGGAAYTQAGGPFQGLEQVIMGLLGPELKQMSEMSIEGRASDFAQQITANLMAQSLQLGAGQSEELKAAFGSGKISEDEQGALINFFESKDLSDKAVQDELIFMLEKMSGLELSLKPFQDTTETAAIKFEGASKAFADAVTDIIAAIKGPPPDTRSPRAIGDTGSNLSKTMASHNALSSSMPGKRVITSSYRNFALGSLKSDHLTGNALDLVGDNLVSYRDAVNRSGGFAEFHGGLGSSRHLHVVPNSRAIGDSSTQVAPMLSSGSPSSSGVVVNNTFNISGTDGPQDELVNTIITRINNSIRDARERK